MLETLSLEEKVGQLLIFGFAGPTVDRHIRESIREYNLGGVIHFARNVQNPKQLAQLNKELQGLAKESRTGLKLFIAIDQEGGTVARLTEGVAVAPSAMALGAVGSVSLTEQVCTVVGKELCACGVNINLAPVLDVNSNPLNPVIGVRSFGEDPRLVAEQGAAAIRGYQKHLISVVKHFPGHGDTDLDSHLVLPIVDRPLEQLFQLELLPFQRAIAAGVGGILTTHVIFPALDDLPATLSAPVLTGLLREKLGYNGLILTDCLEMEAIQNSYGTVEAAVRSVQAGADLVIISATPKLQKGAFKALLQAVKTGRISEQRIDQSLARILQAKSFLPISRPSLSMVGSPAHGDLIQEAIAKSISLGRNESVLPLGSEGIAVVEPDSTEVHGAVDSALKISAKTGTLASALRRNGLWNLESLLISLNPSPAERSQVVAATEGYEKVVVVTSDAQRHKAQAELVQALLAAGRQVVAVGARAAYELSVLSGVHAYLAAYGSRPLVWDQVAKILLGHKQAREGG